MTTTYHDFKYLQEHGYVRNRTTLKRWTDAGIFPKGVKRGPNTRNWTSEELAEYDRQQAAKRDGQAA